MQLFEVHRGATRKAELEGQRQRRMKAKNDFYDMLKGSKHVKATSMYGPAPGAAHWLSGQRSHPGVSDHGEPRTGPWTV